MHHVSTTAHLKSIFKSFFGLVRNPETIAGNVLETTADWQQTRRWFLLLLGLPFFLTVVGFLVTGLFVSFRSTSNIVQTSLVEADKRISSLELEKLAFNEHYYRNGVKERPDPTLYFEEPEEVENSLGRSLFEVGDEFSSSDRFREVDVLLRRARYANKDSVQAKYRLALLTSVDTQNKEGLAQSDAMMGELAEDDAELNMQAHAWMAVSLLGPGKEQGNATLKELENHLRYASQWKMIEPELLTIYSRICLNNGRPDRALAVAKQAAQSRPELNLEYARLCKALGTDYQKEMEKAAVAAEEAFKAKLATPAETDNDRIGLAHALILQDRRDAAVEILQAGLGENPKENVRLRRGLASLFIEKFRRDNSETFQKAQAAKAKALEVGSENDEEKWEVDWSQLQEAATFDRENPLVGEEIAVYWRRVTRPPDDLLEVLRFQLKNGMASIAARLMLAELYLVSGKVTEAKLQWEAILSKDPYVYQALNNLAVVLSREKNKTEVERAIELIDRAYKINPTEAEICDTYGEVYMNAGRYLEAIAKLEESIRHDPKRISSRQRLVECYRVLGMTEMVTEQENQINRIQSEAAKKPE